MNADVSWDITLFLSPNLEKKINSHQHWSNQTTGKCKKTKHTTEIRYLIQYEMSFQDL
jgi:hypothetical protein